MKISIIIPAHNEEKRIRKTLEEYQKFFKNLKKQRKVDFEIIIVINDTIDKTEEIVKEFSEKHSEIKFININERGKGLAIIRGFKDSLKRKNDLIGFVDADMATTPEEFYKLITNLGRYDGIIASRAKQGAVVKMSLVRKITHRGFNFLVRSLFLINYKDTQCGAKLFKRKVIEKISNELRLTQWAFDVNLLYLCKKKGYKIKEYPTIWRNANNSKIISLIRTTMQMFFGAIRLRSIYSPFEHLLTPLRPIVHMGDKWINK